MFGSISIPDPEALARLHHIQAQFAANCAKRVRSAPQPDFRYEQFQRCWPWLAAAVARYAPTHSFDDVWSEIAGGDAQLWPMPHAVIVTTIKVYPSGFKELVFWLAGGDLSEILQMRPLIEAWAAERGCDRVAINGRPGWQRKLPDYTPALVILTKDLKR